MQAQWKSHVARLCSMPVCVMLLCVNRTTLAKLSFSSGSNEILLDNLDLGILNLSSEFRLSRGFCSSLRLSLRHPESAGISPSQGLLLYSKVYSSVKFSSNPQVTREKDGRLNCCSKEERRTRNRNEGETSALCSIPHV